MKIVNVVLAIGTLIILGALITLGIKTFYPEPQSPNSLNYPMEPAIAQCAPGDVPCIQNNSSSQAAFQQQMDQYQQAEQSYQDAMQLYNRNLFIIANVVGIIVFVLGFFIVLYAGLASQGVPIGIMMAGLWGIIYGYGRGWDSIDDRLKFIVGLVVAVCVIGGSMWLMQRHEKKGKR
jgi:heme/copper-type cytochrome/quinol oxidase subunit 4